MVQLAASLLPWVRVVAPAVTAKDGAWSSALAPLLSAVTRSCLLSPSKSARATAAGPSPTVKGEAGRMASPWASAAPAPVAKTEARSANECRQSSWSRAGARRRRPGSGCRSDENPERPRQVRPPPLIRPAWRRRTCPNQRLSQMRTRRALRRCTSVPSYPRGPLNGGSCVTPACSRVSRGAADGPQAVHRRSWVVVSARSRCLPGSKPARRTTRCPPSPASRPRACRSRPRPCHSSSSP